MSKKIILLSSLILSLGIVMGCYLIASKPQSTSNPPQNIVQEQNTIMLDIEETSKFLGLSTDEIKRVIAAEKASAESSDVFEGERLQYIEIEGTKYFEKTNLLKWAQDSTAMHRNYSNGTVGY